MPPVAHNTYGYFCSSAVPINVGLYIILYGLDCNFSSLIIESIECQNADYKSTNEFSYYCKDIIGFINTCRHGLRVSLIFQDIKILLYK